MPPNPHRVALVTSGRLGERGWTDNDTPLVHAALTERGIDAGLVAWHDDVEWSAYSLAVLRSPWDMFTGHLDEFLVWIDKVATQTTVLNAPAVVHRVLDKHYLGDLALAGVQTIPTEFIEVGQPAAFPDTDFVVKPVISGGASNSARYRPDEIAAATAHVAFLHTHDLGAMVQPYMESIDTKGERALMFFNGSYDHAIVKEAILEHDQSFEMVRKLHPGPRACVATEAELAIARAALEVMGSTDEMLSGRVDMVCDANGNPAIMELELIAPVIFLTHDDGAAGRFADAICKRLP